MNVAFIPVRGGSKSIPLKNIKLIAGRPLIYWSLDAAVNSKHIDIVYVATDSEKIRKVVEKYPSNKVKVIGRSEESASDTASTEFCMLEFADEYDFDKIILIQATSPLILAKNIDEGFEKLKCKEADSIISLVRQKRFIWQDNEDEAVNPLNYDYLNRPRRQEFNGFLVENGAFYITSKELLLKNQCRISGKIGYVEMDEDSYTEIDEISDWIITEQLLKKSRKKNEFGNIKILLTDSDGVLTDCGMYYSENGDELKKFNAKDGMAFKILREHGIKTGIITGEERELIKMRADKLKVDELHMGIGNKLEIVKEICDKYAVTLQEVAYIGDDINDLEVIKNVGFGCAVNDAMEVVKEASDYVTKVNGGEGAIREIAEILLQR
ncbi:acylneuraminate cytidylyltransferase [Clostridium sp. BL-8]|uniref:acylneuraminate cytidylyltransferase n=1 Tax=Clostridium sp. BL-8 TaxID=349938 RepID=UPI00098BDCFB|nr:acylneuraminate cytidylyltransferase [Clostridium sp. BL-8]OOM79973.1 3-deoxy-D-manno-octulosonate 8-phosphate phosphatase KdsC [Clostridium sp. BL-8]